MLTVQTPHFGAYIGRFTKPMTEETLTGMSYPPYQRQLFDEAKTLNPSYTPHMLPRENVNSGPGFDILFLNRLEEKKYHRFANAALGLAKRFGLTNRFIKRRVQEAQEAKRTFDLNLTPTKTETYGQYGRRRNQVVFDEASQTAISAMTPRVYQPEALTVPAEDAESTEAAGRRRLSLVG